MVAYVALKPVMNLNPEELGRHCRQTPANHKVPRHIDFSQTDLPKSGSGKTLNGSCASFSGLARLLWPVTEAGDGREPGLASPWFHATNHLDRVGLDYEEESSF